MLEILILEQNSGSSNVCLFNITRSHGLFIYLLLLFFFLKNTFDSVVFGWNARMNRICSSSPFCGMFISIDNRVRIAIITFFQLYCKNRSRLCRGALMYEIETMVLSFALVVNKKTNGKGGRGNVTV